MAHIIGLHKTLRMKYPPKKLRNFYTYKFGFLIWSLLTVARCESYLEVGSGFGPTMLMAGDAIKGKKGYRLIGLETKSHRAEYSRKLLEEFGVKADVIEKDFRKFELEGSVDALFSDPSGRFNQRVLDKYGDSVNKLIFMHDIQESELKFPEGFIPFYFPERLAVAFRKESFVL